MSEIPKEAREAAVAVVTMLEDSEHMACACNSHVPDVTEIIARTYAQKEAELHNLRKLVEAHRELTASYERANDKQEAALKLGDELAAISIEKHSDEALRAWSDSLQFVARRYQEARK